MPAGSPWAVLRGLPAAPTQALSPVPLRLLPSKCASYYGDIASLAQEEPNEVHLCSIMLFSAADLDAWSLGPGSVSPQDGTALLWAPRPAPPLCPKQRLLQPSSW